MTVFLFTYCGEGDKDKSDKSKSPEGSKKSETKKTSSEGMFENKFVKVKLPDGWEVFDDNAEKMGMMRIRMKGDLTGKKPTIFLKFEGKLSGRAPWKGSPEESLATFAKQYKGSEPEKVTYNGVEYYKTSYDYSGKQTMLVTKKDDTKITVTIAGENVDKTPEVEKILDTMTFK